MVIFHLLPAPCSVLSGGKGSCHTSLAVGSYGVGMELLSASAVQKQISCGGCWGTSGTTEDGHTGAGSVGRLENEMWHFQVAFPLCYQISYWNMLFPS